MRVPYDSTECRQKAEVLEMMARTVSYQPDRDQLRAQALLWREREQTALQSEAVKDPPP